MPSSTTSNARHKEATKSTHRKGRGRLRRSGWQPSGSRRSRRWTTGQASPANRGPSPLPVTAPPSRFEPSPMTSGLSANTPRPESERQRGGWGKEGGGVGVNQVRTQSRESRCEKKISSSEQSRHGGQPQHHTEPKRWLERSSRVRRRQLASEAGRVDIPGFEGPPHPTQPR